MKVQSNVQDIRSLTGKWAKVSNLLDLKQLWRRSRTRKAHFSFLNWPCTDCMEHINDKPCWLLFLNLWATQRFVENIVIIIVGFNKSRSTEERGTTGKGKEVYKQQKKSTSSSDMWFVLNAMTIFLSFELEKEWDKDETERGRMTKKDICMSPTWRVWPILSDSRIVGWCIELTWLALLTRSTLFEMILSPIWQNLSNTKLHNTL